MTMNRTTAILLCLIPLAFFSGTRVGTPGGNRAHVQRAFRDGLDAGLYIATAINTGRLDREQAVRFYTDLLEGYKFRAGRK